MTKELADTIEVDEGFKVEPEAYANDVRAIVDAIQFLGSINWGRMSKAVADGNYEHERTEGVAPEHAVLRIIGLFLPQTQTVNWAMVEALVSGLAHISRHKLQNDLFSGTMIMARDGWVKREAAPNWSMLLHKILGG